MLLNAVSVLIVAAHPDDEVLGCGGTIARHADAGATVDILFLADGLSSRGAATTADIEERSQAAIAAAEILGAQPPRFLTFPDNRMDSVPLLDIVQSVEAALRFKPYDLIYTHSSADLNVDHQVAARAVRTAARPLPGQSVAAILAFEVPSSTEWGFGPGSDTPFNVVIDIGAQIDRKVAALGAYEKELRAPPHPRSQENVLALARLRGATHGFHHGEAFSLVRASLA